MEFCFIALLMLAAFAVFDLIVGVSNDATNFMTSSVGSKAAPRYVILIIASVGMMAGVSFSGGMMEVARKGIFHPQLFTMPEMMVIFLAVMVSDIILLDIFNTFGMPTSTTVSIVFDLLGAAVAVSLMKIANLDQQLSALGQYINTGKAMMIIFGILLSVILSFFFGTIAQFFTRLLFTFEYMKRMKYFGALWGGLALSMITYFILVKGAKGAFFISGQTAEWIESNSMIVIPVIFLFSAVFLQLLLMFKVNILKPVILIGTFALAMAFAANDLVNFIGVPMAGYHAYKEALKSEAPLEITMDALGSKVPTETSFLIISGLIMVITLCMSKRARTVQNTELSLGQQGEGVEKFESMLLSRIIVRMTLAVAGVVRRLIPEKVFIWMDKRMDSTKTSRESLSQFDLLRASVNLMVASALISYATSQKLPLSTTYVTFMVSMGTSFADRAWGRESAVYRITGVITVIGGWFMTAFLAFSMSFISALIIYCGKGAGIAVTVLIGVFLMWKNHNRHKARSKDTDREEVFNLSHINDVKLAIYTTFKHTGIFIKEIEESLDLAMKGLFEQNEGILGIEKNKTKKINRWSNIIIANIFKAMRLLQREQGELTAKYGQTIRRIQKLADGHRDIVTRCYLHVSNQHKGLLDVQIEELKQVSSILNSILKEVEKALEEKDFERYVSISRKDMELRKLAEELNRKQTQRIQSGESKTRLTILFYAVVGNAMMMSKQNLKLVNIFSETFGGVKIPKEYDRE